MFLVADKLNYTQAGLSLVELNRNGRTDGKSDEKLKQSGRAAGIDSIPVGTHAGVAGDFAAVSHSPELQRKEA